MGKKKTVNSGGNGKYTKLDILKDILFFLITTVCAMVYVMGVLLIISFVTLSYIHFTIEGIFITAVICTVLADAYYIVKMVKKYRGE